MLEPVEIFSRFAELKLKIPVEQIGRVLPSGAPEVGTRIDQPEQYHLNSTCSSPE